MKNLGWYYYWCWGGVGYTAAKENSQKFADDQHIKNDRLPSSNGGKEFSTQCVKVYLNAFYEDEKISTNKRVSRKTVIFIAVYNYLRSTTSYLMNISASNSIEGKIPKNHPENTKLGTYGYQKLVTHWM